VAVYNTPYVEVQPLLRNWGDIYWPLGHSW